MDSCYEKSGRCIVPVFAGCAIIIGTGNCNSISLGCFLAAYQRKSRDVGIDHWLCSGYVSTG
ncbi:hypothetical protein ES703_115127 [subsurface metagenome]